MQERPHRRRLRRAHTVKGSAGIFGLDAVVGVTGHVETVLGHPREGEITLTQPLSTPPLQCNDQIRQPIVECTDSPPALAARAARHPTMRRPR